jgi:hypothetical protein
MMTNIVEKQTDGQSEHYMVLTARCGALINKTNKT